VGTPPGPPWYQADITITARGTYSGASPYTLATIAPNHLTFQARIYELASNPVTCLKNNLKCIIAGRMAGTGTFTGTLPNSMALDSGRSPRHRRRRPPAKTW